MNPGLIVSMYVSHKMGLATGFVSLTLMLFNISGKGIPYMI